MMQYEIISAFNKEQAESKLDDTEGEELCLVLLSLYEIEDWQWVQDIYLKYINDKDNWVASAAITGLGHLARVSGKITKGKVIALENARQNNPDLNGKIADAISDLNMYGVNSPWLAKASGLSMPYYSLSSV